MYLAMLLAVFLATEPEIHAINPSHHHEGLCGCEALVQKHVRQGHAITSMKANGDNLVVTEIMQNPNAVSDTNGEWFEVFNPGSTAVNMNGWTLRDNGSDNHLISSDLFVPAGGYVVLGRNSNTVSNGGITVDYQYSSFILANGADEVVLVRPDSSIADEVSYSGANPWPDPTGASMVLSSAVVDNNIGSNWSTSTESLPSGDAGTPGDGPDAAQDLVVSEIMQNPNAVSDTSGEWFEVFNPGSSTVNMNGWTLRDDGSDSHTISTDILVSPQSYLVLGRNANAASNGGITVSYQYSSFLLSNSADEVILERPDGTVADEVRYTGSNPWPNASGASMELNAAALDNSVGSNWSTATSPLANGDLATPGSGPDGSTNPPGNQAPIVDAGPPTTAYLEAASVQITLSGTATDPNSDPMTHAWTLVSGVAGNVSIQSSSSLSTTVTLTALGNYSFQLASSDAEFTSIDTVSVSIIERPVFGGNYQIYFGNLHAHSAYSDGNKANDPNYNNVENAFRFGRDSGGLDWLLMADHNHNSAGMTLSEFNLGTAETATVNNESANFSAIYGSEWGTISTGGHVIFASDQLVGWEAGNYDTFVAKGDYTALFAHLNTVGGFAELCHPSSDHFDNIFNSPYNASWDNVISLISVRSGPAFATETDYSNPSSSSYLSYYYNLLLKGYHVGPAGDQDTHYDNWGLANEQRTAVLATENTPTAIIDALKAGRVYAVQDRNITVSFNANYQGQAYQMASVVQVPVGDPVNFQVEIQDPDGEATASVELWGGSIGGSSVTQIHSSSGSLLNHSFTPQNLGQTDFFLVIVTQADGQQAWSSPIWIEGSTASVNPPPVAQFTPSVTNLQVVFTDQSSDNGAITSWQWQFGDGQTSSAQNPVHTYVTAGAYTVTLTVADDQGATDSTSQSVTATAPPVGQWQILESNDFESGLGNFIDGGSDCRRSSADANFANSGIYCVRLRDNSGIASSLFTNVGHDITGQNEFRIEFSYIANSMELGEDFFVEFWSGNQWVIVANYVRGTDFSNGQRKNEVILLDSSQVNFSDHAGIRFRCDASANADRIFIDDVSLSVR